MSTAKLAAFALRIRLLSRLGAPPFDTPLLALRPPIIAPSSIYINVAESLQVVICNIYCLARELIADIAAVDNYAFRLEPVCRFIHAGYPNCRCILVLLDNYLNDYYERRRIGFDYDAPRMGDPVSYGGDYERGYGSGSMYNGMSREMADEWMHGLENEDGSRGAHWSYDQTSNLLSQKKYDCDPIEFYVAMNMLYSDYFKVAKKFNVNNTEFYADLAEAFLCDKDAADDKLIRYYECVVD